MELQPEVKTAVYTGRGDTTEERSLGAPRREEIPCVVSSFLSVISPC